jgi:splicing factor 3A subunit 3
VPLRGALVQELLTLGSDALKDALSRLGLKAGGTDAERAARLYSTKGKRLDQLDKKLFQRGAAPPSDEAAAARAAAAARDIAALEADAMCMIEQLRDVIKATRGNVEKKTTLSYQELEAERMEEEYDQPEEGDVRGVRCAIVAYACVLAAVPFCATESARMCVLVSTLRAAGGGG